MPKNISCPRDNTCDYAKAFDCVDHYKLWKILQEMGIPDYLTCLLRNLYVGQKATVNHYASFCLQTWVTVGTKRSKTLGRRNTSTYGRSTGSWGQCTCLFFCFVFVLHLWSSVQLPGWREDKTWLCSLALLKCLALILTFGGKIPPLWRWTALLIILVELIMAVSSKKALS